MIWPRLYVVSERCNAIGTTVTTVSRTAQPQKKNVGKRSFSNSIQFGVKPCNVFVTMIQHVARLQQNSASANEKCHVVTGSFGTS